MNIISTNKVYVPKIVEDSSTPVYKPTVVTEINSTPQLQVSDMYLTKEETEQGTIWYLNVIIFEQEYKYRLVVHYA